ncbi:hypothetical protein AB6A40_005936 [Gnathostoma spinigerum]|uniref:acid phosphatase n=1 Tax=Gnathostoma spinigerum TaxID=75299 RepID=A0ABD6EJ38_9BILA
MASNATKEDSNCATNVSITKGAGQTIHIAEKNVPKRFEFEEGWVKKNFVVYQRTIRLSAAIVGFIVVFIIALILFLVIHPYSVEKLEKTELIYVFAVWRHGDRGPVHLIDGLPFNKSWFPKGLGKLTTVGEQQAEQLGREFAKRYGSRGLLNAENVFIRSTNYSRTRNTAKYVMKGANLTNVTLPPPISTKEDVVAYPFFTCAKAKNIIGSVLSAAMMKDKVRFKCWWSSNHSYRAHSR